MFLTTIAPHFPLLPLETATDRNTSPEFWLNAQIAWDLWHAAHSDKAEEINQLEPVRASA